MSKLKEKDNVTKDKVDSEFSSEDDIPLSDLNKPRTRSRTIKKLVSTPNARFPCKSKSGVTYEESDLSDQASDNSLVRKKKKVNPLLLPGPSNDCLQVQGYIT